MTNWRQTSVAADATHHLLAGLALYSERFDEVLKFHEPGLAPVRRGDEAWHIDVSGMPAYRQRFRRTFGFYEHRAAVQAATGWCHIRPDGSLVGQGGLAWCGNFQEGRCTVRAEDGLFFHVDLDGAPICAGRHLYVGDYRDGLAVVRGRDDGLCTHVDLAGRETHRKRFLDLDVFHKGMARARDGAGWFHIGLDGRAAYEARFENVEPFYNGLALAWTWSGSRVLIDRAAVVRHVVTPVAGRAGDPRAKILVLGNLGTGKTTLARPLAQHLGWRFASIDDCRRSHGDGTPAGELRAWAAFVEVAASAGAVVMECSGVGPHVPLLRLALRESGDRVGVLWVHAPIATCVARVRDRSACAPYPRFGMSQEAVVADLDVLVAESVSQGGAWHRELIGSVDGTAPGIVAIDHALQSVNRWLEG